jgi:kumamolisin
MKRITDFALFLLMIGLSFVGYETVALAQSRLKPLSTTISVPASSAEKPGGLRAHTNVRYLSWQGVPAIPEASGPPFPGLFYESPASLACIYDLQPQVPGCNPNVVSANPTGGGRAIAIVDAYDDPEAHGDLSIFSTQFGVAQIGSPQFTVVYAPFHGASPGSCTGAATRPAVDPSGGWEIEESLDIEMAHSMAPAAKLYLVEAQSDYYTDLLCAVSVASKLVAKAGGGEVSMSWGGGEPAYFNAQYPTQTSMDPVLTQRGVVYFASAGDSPGPIWPSTSPNVVSAGGTTLSTDATTGNFLVENTWQDAGGGPSIVEQRPAYQNGIAHLVGTQRGTPDVAANANPSTGVWVQDSFPLEGFLPCPAKTPCWYVVGGTSVSSPMIAGIVNAAGSFSESSHQELSEIYSKPSGFKDIVLGTCGIYIGNLASTGWDFCTGWGSPMGYVGK